MNNRSSNKYRTFYESLLFATHRSVSDDNRSVSDDNRSVSDDNKRYIELRCFFPNGPIISKYFTDVDKLLKFILDNRLKTNIYVGINPRSCEGRNNKSVKSLTNIIFDLEMSGTKKELYVKDKHGNEVESEYLNKLLHTVNYIEQLLEVDHGLNVSAVVTSGRGLHVYVNLMDEINEPLKYKQQYKNWYKKVCDKINRTGPYAGDIKVDAMCSDFVRILGAPGSVNIKYAERPVRKILYLNVETDNKLEEKLKQETVYRRIGVARSRNIGSKNRTKRTVYDEVSIFESPELKVFEYNPEPGTQINNKLRLALKLLMARDKCYNYDEVADYIEKLGFPWKDMGFVERDYPDYNYNENILNNYVLDNYGWSVRVGFKLPYKLKEERRSTKNKRFLRDIKTLNPTGKYDFVDDEFGTISNVTELVDEIMRFNTKFNRPEGQFKFLYIDALRNNIKKNVTDDTFWEFLEFNNLIERLQYLI